MMVKDIEITRPFCVFVDEALDLPGVWIAKVVGADGLDYITQADSPEGAVFMAWDLLRLVTGRCSVDRPRHEYTFDTTLTDGSPARGCAHCDIRTRKDEDA
jgi:hypothetical protein